MSLSNSIHSLRCRLCRNGLIGEYNLYTIASGQFGLSGEPVLFGHTRGYFYLKNPRHFGEILEIAGDLAERTEHSFKLLVFDDNASAGNLILINGCFFRVEYVREIVPQCRILELEVYRNAASN